MYTWKEIKTRHVQKSFVRFLLSCQSNSKTEFLVKMQLEKIIVKCSPSRLPYSLPVFLEFANRTKNIVFDSSVHIHSDVRLNDSALREKLLNFLPTQSVNGTKPNVTLTLLYTNTKYLSFELNNHKIEGEVNLVKYLATKLKVWDEIHPVDEARLDDIYNVLICDDNLKICLKTFQLVLQEWIEGSKKFISYRDKFGVTDLLAYSHAIIIPTNKWSDPVILEWIKNCSTHLSAESKEEQNSGVEKQKLFDYFNQHQIEFDSIDHPEVFTVEAMMPYLQNITGAISKNLFLKDKKGNLYLLSALHDKAVNLTDIGKKIKAPGGLRFASEDILFEALGVKQGHVTAYSLINDEEKKVKFLIDDDIINGQFERVYFHPLINTATTGISCDDFKRFVSLTGHEITSVVL